MAGGGRLTSADAAGGMSADESAIRAVLEDFSRAFEERDAELYAKNFSEDADWENSFGGRARGRASIEAFIRRVYPLFADARQKLRDVRIDFVVSDVAVVDVQRELIGQVTERGEPVPTRRVRTTQVLRKEDGVWRVVVHRAADLRIHSKARPLVRRVSLALACAWLLASSMACARVEDRTRSGVSTVAVAYCCGDRVLSPAMDTNARLLVFLPLAEFDDRGQLEGRLARRWEHSQDYQEWTYHLRTDVRWHDGVRATAHDVKFTMDLWAHPEVGWYGAAGVETTTVLNDSTVVIRYRQPTDALRYQPWLVYYPKHLLEHLNPEEFFEWEFWTHPVGNGPYRFVRLVAQTMMEFEANPDYYAGRPQVDRVVLKFVGDAGLVEVLSGNVDAWVPADPDQASRLATDPRFHAYHSYSADAGLAIYWRNDHAFFRDRRVRRALTLAIDRRELSQILNLPGTTPIVDGPFTERQLRRGTLPEPPPHDRAEARALLEAAGWRDRDEQGIRRRDGESFRFTALAGNDPMLQKIAVYVQDQLRRVGVQMDVQLLDGSVAYQRLSAREFEAVIVVTFDGLPRLYGPGGVLGYQNGEAAELIERIEGTADPDTLDHLYRKLTEIFQADGPATFLFPIVNFVVAHRRLEGLSSPWRADPVAHMADLWIKDEP